MRKGGAAPYLALAVLALGVAGAWAFRTTVPDPDREAMLLSARRMEEAEDAVRSEARRRAIPLEPEDTGETWLLGPDLSPLVSTMGYPAVKRTTVQPDCAAMLYRLYREAGLRKGDVVGIGTSGSFPGLLVAALCAAKTYGLEVRVIASLGSSMYGATRPELNVLDILRILGDSGLVDFTLAAVSPGCEGDRGVGAFDDLVFAHTRETNLALLAASGAPVIDEGDMEKNLAMRRKAYGPIDLFVNIGGAQANIAGTLPPGLVSHTVRDGDGLAFRYLAEGVSVVNLLDVRRLCTAYGIPIDGGRTEPDPASGVYAAVRYARIPVYGSLLVAAVLVCLGWRRRKR